MSPDVQTVVVGGGVVGLSIAQALARRGHEVVLLEQHTRLGSETSSRNSEVVHAGLYYPPGSLRAKLCVAGRRMLCDFAAQARVTMHRCGKLLIATTSAEVTRLEAIAKTAAANGVDDLVFLDEAAARRLERELRCVAAILSPSTAVIDTAGLMIALEGQFVSYGGIVVLNTRVAAIACQSDGDYALSTSTKGDTGSITAQNVVIAAGHGSTPLAAGMVWPAGYAPPQTYPAKGHYFALAGRHPFRHLIYPMPQGAWLGVHLTIDTAGRAKFGPDIEWVESVDYRFDDPDGARRARFETEIRRYWPGLPDGALHPDYTGVRPKIYKHNEPAADFAIHTEREHGRPRLVALFGIESPGLTASLAIGEYVADALSA